VFLLVVETGKQNKGGTEVKHGKDADFEHLLIKRSGSESFVLFHEGPSAPQGDEARDEEEEADEKKCSQWNEHKCDQIGRIPGANEADTCEEVALNLIHGQHDDGHDGRDGPREKVKAVTVGLHRLMSPLEGGSHKPGDCEHDPPNRVGYREEVQGHERKSTLLLAIALRNCARHLNVGHVGWEGLVAGHRITKEEAVYKHEAYEEVTAAQEDDGTLRKVESFGLNVVGKHGECSGDHTKDGPSASPDTDQMPLIGLE